MTTIISILLLTGCYAVAVGFGIRIYKYYQTGNPKYKHDYNCWRDDYTGKHVKRR